MGGAGDGAAVVDYVGDFALIYVGKLPAVGVVMYAHIVVIAEQMGKVSVMRALSDVMTWLSAAKPESRVSQSAVLEMVDVCTNFEYANMSADASADWLHINPLSYEKETGTTWENPLAEYLPHITRVRSFILRELDVGCQRRMLLAEGEKLDGSSDKTLNESRLRFVVAKAIAELAEIDLDFGSFKGFGGGNA